MKINPPILDIPLDNPYLNDLFMRKDFAESLLSLIKNVDESVVLCVDAPWGDGKTTFARMFIADLKIRGINCIYYDAYEHDYFDDPFISFSAEIISLVDNTFKEESFAHTLKKDFKTKAKKVGGKLLTVGTRIGVKAITLGIIKDSDIDAISSIREDIASNAAEASSAIVGRAIDDYSSTKNHIVAFKEKLSELGKEVKNYQKFPLLIIIDELDRCRPDFALTLLERIKHLFNADHLSFLLLTNTTQLENYVKTTYGSDIDARNYLHKFLTLSVKLPKNELDEFKNDYLKYVNHLIKHHGIDGQRDIDSVLVWLFQYYQFSLREMERSISILTIYFSQLTNKPMILNLIASFLAVIKIRFPEIFDDLSTGTITFTSLVDKISLDKIDSTTYSNFPKDMFLNLLKYMLFTDTDFKAWDEKDKYSRFIYDINLGFDLERKKIIPFLCSEFMKFKKVTSDTN
jgi:hypothetical protein